MVWDKIPKYIVVLALIALMAVFSGCIGGGSKGETTPGASHSQATTMTSSHWLSQGTAETPTQNSKTTSTQTSPITTSTPLTTTTDAPSRPPWTPDGVISLGEYDENATFDGFSLYFRVENGTLMVGMSAPTSGWVAVGFGGEGGMRKTDIIIAYVLPNGTVMIGDHYSSGFAGPHNPDEIYGGSFDITAYGGSERDGVTTVEFSRPLDTGDKYDFKIPLGKPFRIIWAYSIADDFLSDHIAAGESYIALGG